MHDGRPESVIVRLDGLTKYYGKRPGVLELDLEVPRGQVFGYLGPNGAGKTTTIRLLLDFIRPTRGRAQVFGQDSQKNPAELHRRIGYLPGELSVYGNLTGAEFLRYFAGLRGSGDRAYVKALAERLGCDLSRPLRALSHGNRQKVGLVQAFMHRPELLILDEPTNGLDPLVQQEFYSLVGDARREGATVFLSSHVLPEIERVCECVGMIKDGRLAAVEHIAALKLRAPRRIEVRFASPVPAEEFNRLPGLQHIEVSGNVLRCTASGPLDALVKAAARFNVVNLVSPEPTLEDIFLTYYGNRVRNNAA